MPAHTISRFQLHRADTYTASLRHALQKHAVSACTFKRKRLRSPTVLRNGGDNKGKTPDHHQRQRDSSPNPIVFRSRSRVPRPSLLGLHLRIKWLRQPRELPVDVFEEQPLLDDFGHGLL